MHSWVCNRLTVWGDDSWCSEENRKTQSKPLKLWLCHQGGVQFRGAALLFHIKRSPARWFKHLIIRILFGPTFQAPSLSEETQSSLEDSMYSLGSFRRCWSVSRKRISFSLLDLLPSWTDGWIEFEQMSVIKFSTKAWWKQLFLNNSVKNVF